MRQLDDRGILYPLAGFCLEMSFRGGNCFCGERKCEKHPGGRLNLLVFGGGGRNLKLRGEISP